jgi:hypothetical protein
MRLSLKQEAHPKALSSSRPASPAASPLPEPPAELAGETFDLQLPIKFRIKGQ